MKARVTELEKELREAKVSLNEHTSTDVSILQHTSAYLSVPQHSFASRRRVLTYAAVRRHLRESCGRQR